MKRVVSMQDVILMAVLLFLAFAMANFAWAALNPSYGWFLAAERCYFNFGALAIFVGLLFLSSVKEFQTTEESPDSP